MTTNDVKICKNCSNQIPVESVFCPYCGEKVSTESKDETVYCVVCGRKISAKEKFCPYCHNEMPEYDGSHSSFPAIKESEAMAVSIHQTANVSKNTLRKKKNNVKGSKNNTVMYIAAPIVILSGLLIYIYYFTDIKLSEITLFSRKEAADQTVSNASPADHGISGLFDDSEEDISFRSQTMKKAMQDYFGKEVISKEDCAQVNSVLFSGDKVQINQNGYSDSNGRTGRADLSDIQLFPSLDQMIICNAENIAFPEGTNSTVTDIRIINCSIPADLAGIEEFRALKRLTVNKTELQSLEQIRKLSYLEELNVSDNQISDVYALEDCANLKKVIIFGNYIWDYRGLRNIEYVDIWREKEGLTEYGSPNAFPNAMQIRVEVSDLHVRSSPSTKDNHNITPLYAEEGYYYLFLDTYWDPVLNAEWYKIGNNLWIAGGDGSRSYITLIQ